MKYILAVVITLILFGCQLPSTTRGLILSTTKVSQGIQVTAKKVSSKDLGSIVYGSPDSTVISINPDPLPNPLPSTTVAILDTQTGLVTPTGSTPSTITITATDGTNYGSTEVTTSIIDLASTATSPVVGNWELLSANNKYYAYTGKDDGSLGPLFKEDIFTAQDPDSLVGTQQEITYDKTGSSTSTSIPIEWQPLHLRFFANVTDPERIHANGISYANRFNAGYFRYIENENSWKTLLGLSPSFESKWTWEAVDGKLQIPPTGDSGIYDDTTYNALLNNPLPGSLISPDQYSPGATLLSMFTIDGTSDTLVFTVQLGTGKSNMNQGIITIETYTFKSYTP